MRLIFALLFSCGLASARAGDQPTTPDFSSYPHTEAFRSYVQEQTNATRHLQHILAMTEFTNAGAVALKYYVTDHGRQRNYTDDWSVHFGVGSGPYTTQLSEAKLRSLVSAIRGLPATNTLPPIDELVIVSFRQGTNWITHSYDKRSLPKAMGEIYDIKRTQWVRSFTVQ